MRNAILINIGRWAQKIKNININGGASNNFDGTMDMAFYGEPFIYPGNDDGSMDIAFYGEPFYN